MAIIQRPAKEGNATTYQGKVAAGYTKILAAEVDADFDTMYAAWNAGVDTVNIKPGAVTAPCLAAGAVTGTALAPGSIATAALADGAVTQVKIAPGVTPTGPAGGSFLGGNYPNPTILDGSITNTQLANRASTRYGASQSFPANWTTPTINTWYQVVSVGINATYANATIFIFGMGSMLAYVGNGYAWWRVRRDGSEFGALNNQAIYKGYSNGGPMMINFALYDSNAPTGNHNYTLEVQCNNGVLQTDAAGQTGYMHVWVMA